MTTSNILPPGLIFQARDIDLLNPPRIDSHLHTTWTDGKATVEEMYSAAIKNGLETVLYSEHSRKTSIDWFPSFAAEVRALPLSPCRAYVGTEVKVESPEGLIDIVSGISDLCDFVTASVHRLVDADGRTVEFAETDPKKAVQMEFELAWAVLGNPRIDILGHMFGMSYRQFNVIPPDNKICALISRAAEFGVAIEINAHYHPNPRKLIQWCFEYKTPITFGSDAHTVESVGAIMRLLGQEIENA